MEFFLAALHCLFIILSLAWYDLNVFCISKIKKNILIRTYFTESLTVDQIR